jgi:hypothetical protein
MNDPYMNGMQLSKEDQARLETQETKIQAVELALDRFGKSSNFDAWIRAETADWEKLKILITIAINSRKQAMEKMKQVHKLRRHLMYAERANARKRRALNRLLLVAKVHKMYPWYKITGLGSYLEIKDQVNAKTKGV